MSTAPTDLEKAALDMKPELRAKLAALLIRSLEEVPDVDEREIEKLWLDEAEERCRQIDAGKVDLEAADEVLRDLRERR